jgi:hypothetical protein
MLRGSSIARGSIALRRYGASERRTECGGSSISWLLATAIVAMTVSPDGPTAGTGAKLNVATLWPTCPRVSIDAASAHVCSHSSGGASVSSSPAKSIKTSTPPCTASAFRTVGGSDPIGKIGAGSDHAHRSERKGAAVAHCTAASASAGVSLASAGRLLSSHADTGRAEIKLEPWRVCRRGELSGIQLGDGRARADGATRLSCDCGELRGERRLRRRGGR